MSLSSESVSSQDKSSGLEIPVTILPPRITLIFRTGEPFYVECCVNTMISNVQALDVEGPGELIAYPPDACRRPMGVTQGLVKWLPTVTGVEYLRIERYRIGIGFSPAVEWSEISGVILEGISHLVYGVCSEQVFVTETFLGDDDTPEEAPKLPYKSDKPDDQPPPAVC